MASKKKTSVKKTTRKVKRSTPKKIELTFDQKRARWRIDPKTGKPLSRYSYEKKYGRKVGTRKNQRAITNKFKRYIELRDDYLEKQNAKRKKKGLKPLTKRQAMAGDDLKNILTDLHEGLRLKRAGKTAEGNKLMLRALKKTGRRDGVPDNVPVGETAQQAGNGS